MIFSMFKVFPHFLSNVSTKWIFTLTHANTYIWHVERRELLLSMAIVDIPVSGRAMYSQIQQNLYAAHGAMLGTHWGQGWV